MKKQTAVEFLFEKILDSNHDDDLYEFLAQAKQMEKKQTMQFAEDFIDWSTDIDPSIYDSFKDAITDYYNKNSLT